MSDPNATAAPAEPGFLDNIKGFLCDKFSIACSATTPPPTADQSPDQQLRTAQKRLEESLPGQAVTQNDGLLGNAAQALLDRRAMVDEALGDGPAKSAPSGPGGP